MSSLLQQLDIFELRPLITNLSCKLSSITEYDLRKQLLCLITYENDIVLRYTSDGGQEVLKLISWFRRTNRVIHDVCFDPSGTWLLVLCFDNTLHIVPALAVVDKTYAEPSLSSSHPPQQPFSTTQVTSYIIPFVGPHECPNSKKCPNRNILKKLRVASGDHQTKDDEHKSSSSPPPPPPAAATTQQKHEDVNNTNNEIEQQLAEQLENVKLEEEEKENEKEILKVDTETNEQDVEVEMQEQDAATMDAFSHDVPASMLAPNAVAGASANQAGEASNTHAAMTTSFMASNTCPYPLSVVWWQTIEGVNRAIIGYSDGSICFVGLSPNCPFVASTAIESGSVVKLLICKDNTFESVMLLITSTLKQQFKLLLEQKAIKYIYPGDISPTSQQARESDWQIVMPLNNTTNTASSSDPASDSSNLDEDVFIKNDDSNTSSASSSSSTAAVTASLLRYAVPQHTVVRNPMPPPPPYSEAINRHNNVVDSAPITTTAAGNPSSAIITSGSGGGGIRFSQQQLPELDDFNERGGGILPAARARLASLKSLGTKKLNAIKMRLSDNRQKLEEYMPENTLSSFAIMDSPSLTPEVLGGNSIGSFYTIQNLRSTYLLSALHGNSNSLTVHSIDINLKPLFLYKIPKNCFDILISSNILYSIQYVDLKEKHVNEQYQHQQQHQQHQQQQLSAQHASTSSSSSATTQAAIETNTEKENRDTDVEKEQNFADGKVFKTTNLTHKHSGDDGDEDDDSLTHDISNGAGTDSADTSATTTTSGHTSTSCCMTPNNSVNAVGVISSAMASMRTGDEDKFNYAAQLGLFRFEHETVLNLYQMATYRSNETSTEVITKEEKAKAFDYREIRSPLDYVQFYESTDAKEEYSLRQMEIMQNDFPKINYDPCYVVTNKNVYYIQLKKEPFAIFLDAALAGEWNQCREFCNTFDLTYEACIEFAGDYLLRRKKVNQALLTYNTAKIKPIRTALKLAMFGHTNALMHLCAMALKTIYVLKSRYFCSPILKTLLEDITYRHSEDVRTILPPKPTTYDSDGVIINEGVACSDYVYGVDDSISNLQMSPSSQFHLANLLLITLAEKAVNDKNYLPLWNFLVTNTKYHTNMTSIVLCQSGLFSAALILTKTRGVCIDTFMALTSVVGQEFGYYTEMNVCLYNLSELMFSETITYLPHFAVDYFMFIQEKLENIRQCVLKRLEQQLNPFSAVLRPIVSHTSSGHVELNFNDNNLFLFDFCKSLIETYLAVLIHMESQRSKREHITNALSTFRITYEDNQFAIETSRFKPISAGCAHCSCVVDGIAYFWGSNGVPCNYSVNKSSDPQEPAHAVKSLEILSQLNLEVHAVKCGRQHTLVLTNNGLYAFGNNNLSQLGIGKHMQMSLQPMVVKVFDGKNVTIIEAGQYHNAAVADGVLYTWGWGIYGQLGHGNTESVAEPKIVAFFKNKKVIQVSLGHAHSLVLCQVPKSSSRDSYTTELYVFGSNHFGQLGIGTGLIASNGGTNTSPDDEMNCTSQVKSLMPLKLNVTNARIRLIHTKFFSNLVVDENECLYTWGSSPQALRLANQIKRRANAKLKIEENQRREMSKRFEATLATNCSGVVPSTSNSFTDAARTTATLERVESKRTITTVVVNSLENLTLNAEQQQKQRAPAITIQSPVSTETIKDEALDETITTNFIAADNVPSSSAAASALVSASSAETVCTNESISVEFTDSVVEEVVVPAQPMQTLPLKRPPPPGIELFSSDTQQQQQQQQQPPPEVDPCEHMLPHLVDTTEVAGQILQISSGLFHYALISSSCTLYTWGKNLEHQLGTGDKERRAVNKPSPIDTIERPMYVDCGADFTLVMTTEYMVKAFGGNSNGQCGRDLGPSIDKMKQRVVCLPTTKRLMRFESQCVEVPVEINLPRPRIRLDNDPVRYLKSIPKYQASFMQEAGINFDDANYEEQPSPSQQYKSTTQADSSENVVTGQDSDDMISSLENLSNNDANGDVCSLNSSYNPAPIEAVAASNEKNAASDDPSYTRLTQIVTVPNTAAPSITTVAVANENHSTAGNTSYTRFLQAAEQQGRAFDVQEMLATAIAPAATPKIQPDDTESNTLTSDAAGGAAAEAAALLEDAENQALRHYIHYCLYVFHGLYNPDKVRDFSKERLEYRIRTLMLNFKFIDAFKLCLDACDSGTKALKIFEYFTKDTGFVPMRRQDLKYLIYYLLLHFLSHKFDLLECERFFLADLNFYLLELAYVLYFNNNNTVLERNLNQKFKSLIAQDGDANQNEQQNTEHKLEDTDVIFDSLSVKFKTIVCQRLMKHCSN